MWLRLKCCKHSNVAKTGVLQQIKCCEIVMQPPIFCCIPSLLKRLYADVSSAQRCDVPNACAHACTHRFDVDIGIAGTLFGSLGQSFPWCLTHAQSMSARMVIPMSTHMSGHGVAQIAPMTRTMKTGVPKPQREAVYHTAIIEPPTTNRHDHEVRAERTCRACCTTAGIRRS